MKTFTRFTLILFVLLVSAFSGSAQSSLWGMAYYGGTSLLGDIFKTDGNGTNPQEMYAFGDSTDGGYPNGGLIQASNGKLYGLASDGGVYGFGVLFEFDPVTNVYTKKADFDYITTGAVPMGTLMQASDGKLYGMNNEGGAFSQGVLFQYDINADTLIDLVDFDGDNGSGPYTNSLIQASNGKLYGMTPIGGANTMGVIFEYDLSDSTFTKLADFPYYENGESSLGTLLEVNDSIFYGLSSWGGVDTVGYIFEFNLRDSSITEKLDFNYAVTGGYPNGSLIKATNGKLYGLTSSGGAIGTGTMFAYDTTTNSFTKILDFGLVDTGVLYTFDPYGTPLQASDGNLYAVSAYGGTYGGTGIGGNLFEYNIANDSYLVTADISSSINANEPMNVQLIEVNSSITGLASPGNPNNGLSAFPNPANEQLFLQTTHGIIRHVTLFDANGRLVYTSDPGNNQISIAVRQFASGMYIAAVVTDEKVLHTKIQIVHN